MNKGNPSYIFYIFYTLILCLKNKSNKLTKQQQQKEEEAANRNPKSTGNYQLTYQKKGVLTIGPRLHTVHYIPYYRYMQGEPRYEDLAVTYVKLANSGGK